MRVSRYYNTNTSITQSSSPRSPERSVSTSASASESTASPAVSSINHDVFSALNEFMYLKGEDRTESYKSLNNKDKDKFISVLNQLIENGTVKKDSLSVEGSDNPDIIKQALTDRKYNAPKSYDQSGSSSVLE